MADDNDIRKNPFYGYYKSKGLIKFLINNLDKLIIFIERYFIFLIKTKKKQDLQLHELKKKVDIRQSHFDNPKFYIKNFYASFLNLLKEDNLKIGLYEQPIRFVLTFLASFYGHLRLNKSKSIQKVCDNYRFLKGKRVLIIGTGSSIDQVNKIYLKNYDHVFLLNKSIKIYNEKKFLFFDKKKFSFFCADRHRIDQLSKEINNSDIDIIRRIYFPDYPLSILKTDLRRQKLSIIGGHKSWKINYSGFGIGNLFGWHMFYPDDPFDKEIMAQEIKNWIDYNKDPVYVPYSVVFGCITFIAGFKPNNIDLIGCDFTGNFIFKPMHETFTFLADELLKYKINLTNKSFKKVK